MEPRIETHYYSPADWEEEQPRRFFILRELSNGRTLQQIAAALGTTPTNARNICQELRLDLGAQTNPEAVARGFRLGLLI